MDQFVKISLCFMHINFYDIDASFEGETVTETETETAPSPGFTLLASLIGLLVAIPTIRRNRNK